MEHINALVTKVTDTTNRTDDIPIKAVGTSLQLCHSALTDCFYMHFSIPSMRLIPVLIIFGIKCFHEDGENKLLTFLFTC